MAETVPTVSSADSVIITQLRVTGNPVTRTPVILREMMVKAGERLSREDLETLLESSRENLMNTALFNFVNTAVQEEAGGRVTVTVSVIERWYIWPFPILKTGDRNFNVWLETRDLSRLSYGFFIDWRNFTGSRDHLMTRFQFGYDQIYDLEYFYPYINKRQTIGLGGGGGFHGNHEVACQTANNKQQFFHSEEGFARKDFYAFANLQWRPDIYNTHLFEVRYDGDRFADSLALQYPGYSVDGQAQLDYFTVHYKFKSDHRDYAPYPLNGYYFDIEIFKYGIGGRLGTPDVFRVQTTFRKYWKIRPWLFYANGLNCTFSDGSRQPYFMARAIGYDRDIVRGYEYYVVDGNHFGIFKSNLKFALISQKNGEFSFIRSEKFGKFYYALYANLFMDLGYADNPYHDPGMGNTLENDLLVGFGTGLDFVTYYDIVLRVEFSVNRMMEGGFFFHINAPI